MDDLVKIASYTLDRGRVFELDRCDVGRAALTIYDLDGTLDPTNSSGTFYNYINPLKQARLALWNPVLEDWYTRFRGFVESWEYDFDPTQQFNRLTVNLVDLFEIIDAVQMFPGYFGHTCPPEHAGNVFFEDTADGDVHGMQTRINHILSGSVSAPVTLGDCGIDPSWYTSLSGNVSLHESVYAPGASAMEAIQEAADAEFPGVANVFCDRTGQLLALGRFSRFDPVGTAAATPWDFQDWKAGDGAAVAASPSDTAHLRGFSMSRDLQKIINFAQASPITELDGAAFDTRIQANTVQNLTSKGLYGIRSWSADNLITKEGVTDGDVLPGPHVDWDEVRRYADYYVRNYHTPANRVTQITFRSMDPSWPGAAPLWDFLCRSDISDRVALTIGSPGGGGISNHKYYIEGIHQTVEHLRGDYDNVTLTLDLSPDDYYQDSPFAT